MLLDPLQSRVVLQVALKQRFAVLAVNADSPAAITDVLEAARYCDAPVMIEASLWQLTGQSFGAGDAALGMARYLVQIALLANSDRYRGVPVLFHTDHIKGPSTIALLKSAIRGLPTGVGDSVLSPSTVSLDSSSLTLEQNQAMLRDLCRESMDCGRPVTLEMEAGVDDGVTPEPLAEQLVGGVEEEFPGFVHLWAPGVGTRHGLGDQSGFSAEAVARHHAVVSGVAGRPVGIALHGSSGLSEEGLRAGVAAGVVKVNWSSESLLVRSEAAREFYTAQGEALTRGHPDWKATAMDHGVQSFVAQCYQQRVAKLIGLLGGVSKAGSCLKALTKGSPLPGNPAP